VDRSILPAQPPKQDQLNPAVGQPLIPRPVSQTARTGFFTFSPGACICIDPEFPDQENLALRLAEFLSPALGRTLPVQTAGEKPGQGNLHLTTRQPDPDLGGEGYALDISPQAVSLSANAAAGLFYGVQTLRQLLPPSLERGEAHPGPLHMSCVKIRDFPRYAWRGAMLDVARHFFSPADVKRYIELLALYKINRLHLHLSDDQGWRLMIHSWPNLALKGGACAVGGDPGGFYTQEEYIDLCAYARQHFITLIPEIDMPGHTQAALACCPELNPGGKAPPFYTGTQVGFSSLDPQNETTYRFAADVLGELAALTPGPYLHIGGDEAQATRYEEYSAFIQRVQEIVRAQGKVLIGWEELAQAPLQPGSIVQVWMGLGLAQIIQQQLPVILSPALKTYLDMKYHPQTPLGLDWAGYIEVQDAYDWEPELLVPGLPPQSILGIEAPLWTETLRTMEEVEFMAFPRLLGVAETAWSASQTKDWDDFRRRLGAHGPRLEALGVNYYRSSQVAWQKSESTG
jgi:hexosaminidase